MKPLARRAVVWAVCAAMLAAQWPASAWAAAGGGDPKPAEAMKMFRDLGVYKDDADPLKTYLANPDGTLTPIGKTLFLSLKSRYNPAEEVESMKPIFDRLRKNGEFTEPKQDAAARAMKQFELRFGELDTSKPGSAEASVEESFRNGALREALMTGAAITDPPKPGSFSQVQVGDNFEFWDKEGLAFRMTKNQVTTYNRELQKSQRAMNQNRPPQVAAIPETGRYNYEMLQYSFWRLKNQETEYVNATRIDRMIAMAELLGKQYPTDMWFNEKGLEEDLRRQAKAKVYNHRGETYSVFDIVEAKFAARDKYIAGAKTAVTRFETDMNRLKGSPTITDAQVATMSLDEQNALRWLSLTVLETQMFHIKNQAERVDPTSPDAQAIMTIVDKSDMTLKQREAYKAQGRLMKERLDKLKEILDRTRKALNNADYAGSLDSVQAALSSTQKELGDLSVDYSIYLEAPSTASLAKAQASATFGGYNPIRYLNGGISNGLRWAYKKTPEIKVFGYTVMSGGAQYAEDMKVIDGEGGRAPMAKTYNDISALIASGRREDWAKARQMVMAMNPKSTEYSMSTSAGADPAKLNDALRISSSLKASHDRISAVTETNKTLDATASFLTWTVSVALMAPMARGLLNGVGKLSGVGSNLINQGVRIGGVQGIAARVVGRTFLVVGEIAKHSAARLQSLEPDAGRVKAFAGANPAAQYLAASGARWASAATRQATFTALSGGISGGFTVGTHLFDMATNRMGGVNILGWQAIEPGHTMFSEDWDGAGKAFVAGFKGGAWWANESLDTPFVRIPTAALGYIGLPSTVFQGTRWARAMEVVGSRGVVGSLSVGVRTMRNGTLAVEAAEAAGRQGILEKMAEAKWYTGKPQLAFGLSMADNVAKYAIFSQVAQYVGQKYSWYVDTNVPLTVPFAGVINHPEADIERRIKRSNNTGHAWLESPAWLLIPSHSAAGARDAGPYMQTREGMRQYMKAERMNEVANSPVDTHLKLEPVKPPISQRLFEARFWGERPASEWIVTKQAKEEALLYEVTRLAKENGVVNPIELMAVRELNSGDKFRTLHVTEEVQKTAYDVATEGLVNQAQRSLEALTIKPGRTVKGWGEITPETQIEIAKALYRAEVNLGRELPKELSVKVREILKDHLQANLPIGEAGKVLRAAIVDLAVEQPNLDKVQREAIEKVLDWEAAPGGKTYGELTLELRAEAEAKLQRGELTAKEAKALTALYDYILTGDKRFNSFNRTEVVRDRANVIFDSLGEKFAERPEMLKLVESYRREIAEWAEGRKGQPADGAAIPESARATKLSVVIERLESELKARQDALKDGAPGKLGPSERAALDRALTSVKTSAWVVRDAKGGAIPGWRPKQFVRLMQSFLGEGSLTKSVRSMTQELFETARKDNQGRTKFLTAVDGIESDVIAWGKARDAAAPGKEPGMSGLISKLESRLKEAPADLTPKEGSALSALVESISGMDREAMSNGIMTSGRKGRTVQLFVKAPTSLGKTLLAYEGLLPYLEAEAKGRKPPRKVMFLTFNTKLQAQAEFDFLAFNKLGSEVKFETYEGLKTLIAEGKGKGRNIEENYLMLQDEMDAAGQQPALTIGMVSGRVSRLNGQTTAINESNAGVAWGLSRLNTIRVEAAEVQAQRIRSVATGISDAHVERGRLSAIKTAAEDVLEAVSQLKRAKGAVEIGQAERAVETGMTSLRRLVEGGGLPASEAEAADTILAGLGRLKEALAQRPAANPEVRARLASEMELAFSSQRRLMNLTETVEGLNRLPAEARKARMAIEAKIENLQAELAEARKSDSREARLRVDRLNEQIEFAGVEKTMLERFDGVDVSARLMSVDEQIAAIRSGQKPAESVSVNSNLSRLMREFSNLEGQLKPLGAVDEAAMTSYRAETGRTMQLERSIAETQGQLKAAENRGAPTEALSARMKELNAALGESRGQLRALEARLNAGGAGSKVAELTRQSLTLEGRIQSFVGTDVALYRAQTLKSLRFEREMTETQTKIEEAKARNESTSALEARLTELGTGRQIVEGNLRTLESTLKASEGDIAAYRGEAARSAKLEYEIGRTEIAIRAAEKGKQPTADLQARLGELKAGREGSKAGLLKLEASLGSADAAVLKAYRAETARTLGFEREIGETQKAIKSANENRQPTAELEARLTELQAGREISRGELRKLETQLGAVKSTPKLDGLVREAQRLETGMSPERRALHQEYRELIDRVDALSAKMGETKGGERSALEAERATVRGRMRSIEMDLSEGPAEPFLVNKVKRVDLPGALRRIDVLTAEAGRLEREGQLGEAKKLNDKADKLRRLARSEIMKRFDEVGEDIIKLTKSGEPGWDARVNRLLESRRALQEAFTGDESALYTAYRNVKEETRPIGEDPRLTREPYEIPGGEGMDPVAALKRADFLIERARTVEAKPKGGGVGELEARLTAVRGEIERLSAAKESPEYFDAMDRMRRVENDLLDADSFHTADLLLKQIEGDSFVRFLPKMPKFLWQALTGTLPEKAPAGVGLTRFHAAKFLQALSKDPMIPSHQRDNLMWSYLHSMVFPTGVTGRGSYMRSEVVNMVQGFHDSAAGVRVDNRTGKFNVVHNGQWFESMDNASRRWWELEYGTDLTLPYTHNSMSTIKDVTTNKKSYFISLSGTSGNKFEAHLRDNKISIVGEGSAMPKNVLLEIVSTPERRLQRVVQSLENLRAATMDQVVLRETDTIPAEAKKGIDEYLAARKMRLNDPQVLKISDVPGEAAQKWLHTIRETQKNSGLIVLSVSDTRALRKVETELKNAGVRQDEIAKVFADTEYLRLNVPEANVLRQMNIEGLNTGKVKVLILDTRVGGRGLDLNFKGERNSTKPGAFRGYTNFEMLVLGPEEMSAVHMIQAMGRIDTGRTLSRAPRQFSLLMDVETAGTEAVFRAMFEKDPFFLELRKDPTFQAYTRANGGRIDWATANEYLLSRAGDGTGEGQLLAQRAEKAVRENLARRNLEVEENLLVQSQVLTSQPTTQSKNPALERIR